MYSQRFPDGGSLGGMSPGPLLRASHVSLDQPSAIRLLPEEQKLGAIVCSLCLRSAE